MPTITTNLSDRTLSRAQIQASWPTTPSFPLWCTSSYLADIGRVGARGFYDDMWVDREGLGRQTAHGVAGGLSVTHYICFAVPRAGDRGTDEEVIAARAKMKAAICAHPDFADDFWCISNPERPFPSAGRYLVTIMNPNSGNVRCVEEVVYDCPHCAWKEGLTHCTGARADWKPAPALFRAADVVPEHWQARLGTVEVAGETPPDTSASIKDATMEDISSCCSNCGRMSHNARGCEFTPKHYDRIGIEIEGRFLDYRNYSSRISALGGSGAGDGSIASSEDSMAQPYELRTKPGSLRVALEQLVEFYPDETDKTCGMHVHVSILEGNHAYLQTEAFFAYFRARWEAWGARMNLAPDCEFYKRLRGDNDYCNPNTDILTDMTTCDRYSQLNFSAWRGHKTVECRLLPMFRRSSLGVAAVIELMDIYETYLADPAAHGCEEPNEITALVSIPVPYTEVMAPIALDATTTFASFTEALEMELTELPPVGAGMRRVAFPVNQPITVAALAARLAA